MGSVQESVLSHEVGVYLMWMPSLVIKWFDGIIRDADANRAELSALRAERDLLKHQLAVSQNQFDWLRMQVNTLQIERTALLEKAYNIKVPAPEIVRQPVIGEENKLDEFTFDDMGEQLAKKFGLPSYDLLPKLS